MSRIGKLHIAIPAGVTVEQKDNVLTVKGPKGELKQTLNPNITIEIEDNEIKVTRPNDERESRAQLALGYSHAIYLKMPPEVKVDAKTERNKNPLITLESCDKQLLGQICAKIRSFRKPEPYKGKGVKFVGEVIRRKSGKTAAAK